MFSGVEPEQVEDESNNGLLVNNETGPSKRSDSRDRCFIFLLFSCLTLMVIILFGLCIVFLTLFLVYCFRDNEMRVIDCPMKDMEDLGTYRSQDYNRKMHQRIRSLFISKFKSDFGSRNLVFLKAKTEDSPILSVVTNKLQNKNFLYLTGIFDYDYSVLLDIESEKTILFMHRVSDHDKIWSMVYPYHTPESIKSRYGVDEVLYNNQVNISNVFDRYSSNFTFFHEPGVTFNFSLPFETVNDKVLFDYMGQIRTVKTTEEIDILKYVIWVASASHRELMKVSTKLDWEYEFAGLFMNLAMSCGTLNLGYPSIVGSGRDASILHYETDRNRVYHDHSDHSFLLVDAGSSFLGYSSDITSSFPTTINGKFTKKQKEVYEMVLDVQKSAIMKIKHGLNFKELTNSVYLDILYHLQKNEFLLEGSLDDMFDLEIHRLFMPHGLGHHIGLDVHDYDDDHCIPSILETNNVITIEPGIYFIQYLIETSSLEQKNYINVGKVSKYFDLGGVRIEDDILVTSDGSVILSDFPKEVDDIEDLTS